MADFKKGDTVRLKSGSPLMTIEHIGEFAGMKEGARCVWFEGSQRQSEVFDTAVLKPSDNKVRPARSERA